MKISLIVAASENNVIGHDNRMLWRLSGDMKRFKALTMGHPVVMGRKTFESIGKALPGRKNIIITRNKDYRAEGCETVYNLDEVIDNPDFADEIFVIGGGDIYTQLWDKADKLYLTRVHAHISGETVIPEINDSWVEVKREKFASDEKNEHDYTFIDYVKG